MIDSIKSRVAFAILIVIAASIALAFTFTYSSNIISNKIQTDKRILGFVETYNVSVHSIKPTFKLVNINDFAVDSSVHFLNPYGKAMAAYSDTMSDAEKEALVKDTDIYEWYILIRLPSNLTSGQPINQLRAYSMLDPESKCLLSYRTLSDNQAQLEDPCHSDVFRATDGHSCYGHVAVGSNVVVSSYNAIPRMRIAVDNQGYILAIKPDEQPTGDGTVGEGRIIQPDEIVSITNDSTCDRYKIQ